MPRNIKNIIMYLSSHSIWITNEKRKWSNKQIHYQKIISINLAYTETLNPWLSHSSTLLSHVVLVNWIVQASPLTPPPKNTSGQITSWDCFREPGTQRKIPIAREDIKKWWLKKQKCEGREPYTLYSSSGHLLQHDTITSMYNWQWQT